MTRIELLYHVEALTKIELAKRTDEQLLQIYNVLTKNDTRLVTLKAAPTEPKLEKLTVSPVIQIGDEKYCGPVEVPGAIAAQLRYMMNQHRARRLRDTTFVDHGTKNLGTI
jgi:hypothetical protein